MNLYIIRHGISNANEKNLVTGDYNDPLSSKGIKQTKVLASSYKKNDFKFGAYYTSQWKRAQDTAKILFPKSET